MEKVKILKIRFDSEIAAYEIPLLRGAIAEKVGLDKDLFTNHIEDQKYIHRYPLIQYKRFNRKAGIVCIGEATQEIQHFFQSDWSLQLHDRSIDLKIEKLDMYDFETIDHPTDREYRYRLQNWLPFDSESYEEWKKTEGLVARTQTLESKILGNILSMAKGLNWSIPFTIKIQILELSDPVFLFFKDTKKEGYQVLFKSNVPLPIGAGLGNKVAFGYGIIHPAPKES